MNFQDVVFGQKHPNFEYSDFEVLQKVKRLAKKHHRLAEMDCNGYGVVKGKMYYNGTIDSYAKKNYGYNVQSAFVEDEVTIFDVEADRIEDKIKDLIKGTAFNVEFQGDPRGNTVKLTFEGAFIEL